MGKKKGKRQDDERKMQSDVDKNEKSGRIVKPGRQVDEAPEQFPGSEQEGAISAGQGAVKKKLVTRPFEQHQSTDTKMTVTHQKAWKQQRGGTQEQMWKQTGPEKIGETQQQTWKQQRGWTQEQMWKQTGIEKSGETQQQTWKQQRGGTQEQMWKQTGPEKSGKTQQQTWKQQRGGTQEQMWKQIGPEKSGEAQQQTWKQQRGGTQEQMWKQIGPEKSGEAQEQRGGTQEQMWKQTGPEKSGETQQQTWKQQRGGTGEHTCGIRPQKNNTEKAPTALNLSSQTVDSQSLTSSMSELSTKSTHVSLKRGTVGQKILVETNYLQLFLEKLVDRAYQYDIKFEPDRPKRFLRQAFEEFRSQTMPRIFLAFDGKAIVYSPSKLSPEIISKLFEVKVVEAESGLEKTFKITLKETQDPVIHMDSLRNYQNLRIFDKPMRAIQCLDVILRSPCHLKSVPAGRAFYIPPDTHTILDLKDGYELWYGLFQAAVLGEVPLLNIDICHKSFPSGKNVIDIIKSFRYADVNKELDRRHLSELNSFLKGLILIYNSPNGSKKRYKFNNLKESAEKQIFNTENGQQLTVLKYFESKNHCLKYPKMPCLHVGNVNRAIYLPAELCEVARGQATMKKAGTNQVREIIRYAAVDTQERKNKILECYTPFKHNDDPIVRAFGVKINTSFLDVGARIINTPKLQYGDNKLIESRSGSWRADKVSFIMPSNLIKWAILSTVQKQEFDVRKFCDMIVQCGKNLKMQISDKFVIFKEHDSRRFDATFREIRQQGYQLCFAIITQSPFGNSYADIKQSAEIRNGVLTQCIKSETLRRLNISTVNNILLKVNAKLNGINHKISENDKTEIMKNNVMFLGADVTHPSPDQRSIPSVVGVAASHDEYGFQYNMRWRLQDPKKEIIQDMQNILDEQLEFYKKKRGIYPNKIMYYRDGVSEGQFEHVRQTELMAIDCACRKIMPKPKITCVVVQKRHHTRFFPKPGTNIYKCNKFKNVPPGTIIDTKITHPNESQFFLVSHESIQGTAKPTKYCIIRDDSNFNIDDLQALTYNLCHMFARCNRAVSYPAPAYNAHLAAYRGRVYIEQRDSLNMRNLDREYKIRQVKEEIYIDSPMYFV